MTQNRKAGSVNRIPPPMPLKQDPFPAQAAGRERIPLGKKLVFWLLLGILSVIFAEVTCASSPYPFFDKWGLFVVTPLYTLHLLFLSGLIYQKKKVTLPALILTGVLFGLYEALITKVLWDPTWGDKSSMLGGVAWEQTGVLVFLWHPWFAFILPLAIGERLFTSSGEVLEVFPAFLKRKGGLVSLILLGAFFGMTQGANSISFDATLLSTAEALGVFLAFSLLWKWINKGKSVYLRDLLPRGKNLVVIGLLLAILYGLTTFLVRNEALPRTIGPYLIIGSFYLIAIVLLVANLKKADIAEPMPRLQIGRFPWARIGIFVLAFLVSVVLFSWIKPITGVLIIILWVLGILFTLIQIVRAAIAAIKPAHKTV